MQERPPVSCGFPSLAQQIRSGFREGDLIVLGGDAGSGSSSLALAFALRAAQSGSQVCFMSAEFSEQRTRERVRAAQSQMPQSGIDNTPANDSLAVRYLGGQGLNEIAAALSEYPETEFLIVDGLEALASRTLASDESMAHMVVECKRFAVENRIPLMLVTHIGIDNSKPTDHRPQLKDFGARGAISIHADLVLGLYREELYHDELALKGATELHILKNRYGPVAWVDLYFESSSLRFEDVMEV